MTWTRQQRHKAKAQRLGVAVLLREMLEDAKPSFWLLKYHMARLDKSKPR
jgi:hypothetical protein